MWAARCSRLLGLAAALVAVIGCAGGNAPDASLVVDRAGRRLEVRAKVNAGRFRKGEYHHLLTWSGGKAVTKALFVTDAHDEEVLDALISLGGQPGDNLTVATWEERLDPESGEPDKLAEGDKIKVTLVWEGRTQALPLAEIFKRGGASEVAMRLAGNRAFIDVWKSGCIVCTSSCPGAKVANAAVSIRTWMEEPELFALKEGVLPPDGTEVTVVLSLTGESEREAGE